MAYDKHTWTCDEPITVERLNHIEDGIANAGGDCDCGYECTEGLVTLTEESVTTTSGGGVSRGFLTYVSTSTAPEKLRITFDGSVYECDRTEVAEGFAYGAAGAQSIDFSVYPVGLLLNSDVSVLFTETAGTYSIKIEATEEIITTTPCFDKARGYSCGNITLTEETLTVTIVE